jgi:hypothetical protein
MGTEANLDNEEWRAKNQALRYHCCLLQKKSSLTPTGVPAGCLGEKLQHGWSSPKLPLVAMNRHFE